MPEFALREFRYILQFELAGMLPGLKMPGGSMPVPLAPVAWTAIRLTAVVAVAVVAARNRSSEPKDAHQDYSLDSLPEGFRAKRHAAQREQALHGQGRLRRVIRLGRDGPGVEVDASAFGRLRFRRVG